jgi:hypothetical protein
MGGVGLKIRVVGAPRTVLGIEDSFREPDVLRPPDGREGWPLMYGEL